MYNKLNQTGVWYMISVSPPISLTFQFFMSVLSVYTSCLYYQSVLTDFATCFTPCLYYFYITPYSLSWMLIIIVCNISFFHLPSTCLFYLFTLHYLHTCLSYIYLCLLYSSQKLVIYVCLIISTPSPVSITCLSYLSILPVCPIYMSWLST